MLPKKNRLDRKLVENIFKNGRFVNSANLSLKFLPNQPLPNPPQKGGGNIPHPIRQPADFLIKERGHTNTRISFITPKTASKKAVVRNLLRRRGYAVLKKYTEPHPSPLLKGEGKTHFPTGFTGAFVFGKKSVEVFGGRKKTNYNPIQNLENEIKNILSKIH